MIRSVLVTGASGFIGSRLCEVLSSRGISVIGTSRTRPSKSSQNNPGDFASNRHVQCDLNNLEHVLPHLSDCDAVVHLAGIAHLTGRQARKAKQLYYTVNRDVTVRLARAAQERGVKRFIFLSSIGVNGRTTGQAPFSPDSPIAPHNDYAISKYQAEICLEDLVRGSDMDLAIVRPPLVYGPSAGGNFLRLMQLVRGGLPLPFRDAVCRRSICSLENLVEFLCLCIAHNESVRGVHLIKDACDTSTLQLVNELAMLLGVRPRVFGFPMAPIRRALRLGGRGALWDGLFEPLVIDDSVTRARLGWAPRDNRFETLDKAVKWYSRSERSNTSIRVFR